MAETGSFRLLIVGSAWPPETFIARLIHGLAAAGVEITVASPEKPDRALSPGGRVHWLYAPLWERSFAVRMLRLGRMAGRGMLRAPGDVSRLCRRVGTGSGWIETLQSWNRLLPFAGQRWDVIYFPWNATAITYSPLFDLGCPIVVSCRGAHVNVAPHNPRRAAIREGLRQTFEQATAVHCVSEAIMREAAQFGLDAAKTWVIRPAVDPSFFCPSERERSGDTALRLVTTGSLLWRKGCEYALLAVRALLDQGIDVRLEIIGDGEDRQRLLFAIHDLELEAHVRLQGRLKPEEVCRCLQEADLFLLSSVSEGISNAALEAMACGLPIVTTDCGGMREAVTDGVEGFVAPPRDPNAICAAVATLAADRALRERMGRAARARVLEQFSLHQQISQWLALYRKLLDEARAA